MKTLLLILALCFAITKANAAEPMDLNRDDSKRVLNDLKGLKLQPRGPEVLIYSASLVSCDSYKAPGPIKPGRKPVRSFLERWKCDVVDANDRGNHIRSQDESANDLAFVLSYATKAPGKEFDRHFTVRDLHCMNAPALHRGNKRVSGGGPSCSYQQ